MVVLTCAIQLLETEGQDTRETRGYETQRVEGSVPLVHVVS